MPRSVRYTHPIICEHLAGQYVAGVMSPLVRARTETLIKQTPELAKTVASWAERFAGLQTQLPEEPISRPMWESIDQKITLLDQSNTQDKTPQSVHWWHNLLLWRATGITGLATSFALAMLFIFSPAPAPIEVLVDVPVNAPVPNAVVNSPPSYMAAMSRQLDADTTEDSIRFVINAYKKTDSAPSRLFVQWSERQPRQNTQALHLWAEDIETGALTYIGVEPAAGEPWALNKSTWAAVSNSGRLLMTADDDIPTVANTLFSGPCVQLGSWQQQVI